MSLNYQIILKCSLLYLVGLWKHVQRLIVLRELINSYRLCSASTKQELSKIVKPYRLLFFLCDIKYITVIIYY